MIIAKQSFSVFGLFFEIVQYPKTTPLYYTLSQLPKLSSSRFLDVKKITHHHDTSNLAQTHTYGPRAHHREGVSICVFEDPQQRARRPGTAPGFLGGSVKQELISSQGYRKEIAPHHPERIVVRA